MFEINSLSCQHISITLEHPFMETMATIELDLTDIPNIKCNVFAMGSNYSGIAAELSRILQTCASIPVTVRTLIKYWERENQNKSNGVENSNLSLLLSQDGVQNGNGSHQNGDENKQRQYPMNIDEDSNTADSDGKVTKKRKSDDLEHFQRNDDSKDLFSRIQRSDKDGEYSLILIYLEKQLNCL